MDGRTATSSEVRESDGLRLRRAVVTLLVLACFTLDGIGVNVLISTFVRLAEQECTEESTCEVDAREFSHKCSRVQFAGARKAGEFRSDCVQPDDSCHPQPQPIALLAKHLIGAGIRMRC